MKTILAVTLLALSSMLSTDTKSIHQFKVKTLEGKEFDFASLKGKKIMVVNTASECGFTPQYKDLEALYQKYKDKNFIIIGFPCNDFGGQEPGGANEIREFCTKNYGVTFPLMEKVSIATSPVYQWLTHKDKNGVEDVTVRWNFSKFLINADGNWVKHVGTKINPTDAEVVSWIEGK